MRWAGFSSLSKEGLVGRGEHQPPIVANQRATVVAGGSESAVVAGSMSDSTAAEPEPEPETVVLRSCPSSCNDLPPPDSPPAQRSPTALSTTLAQLAETLSSAELKAGRPAISADTLVSWSEVNFDELLREQNPPLPLTVRVSLAKEHRLLKTIGVSKPVPAPGFANLTEAAVAAIEHEFKKICQRKADHRSYLDANEVMEFFENLGIAEKDQIDAVREEQRTISATSAAGLKSTPAATAHDHLVWFFRDIDAKRDHRVDWYAFYSSRIPIRGTILFVAFSSLQARADHLHRFVAL